MSFNKLRYDNCSYKHVLSESVGPGEYQLGTPPISCDPCFPKDPAYRLQRQGASVSGQQKMIDVDSELMNITRLASNCPNKKYLPKESTCGKICEGDVLHHYSDCDMPTAEETRTSNPACNLRGTGWNRWEWLCMDPQERVLMPFDNMVSNRIIVKDNHRPCVPNPISAEPSLPKPSNKPIITNIVRTCGVPTDPPSVHWRSSEQISRY